MTVAIVLMLMLAGFLIGRYTVKVKVEVKPEYITLPPIHDTLIKPIEVEKTNSVKLDTVSLLKYCLANHLYDYLIRSSDSVNVVIEKVDTLKILEDWLTKRKYELNLFDNDTIGKLDVDAVIQYNQIQHFGYNYIPTHKQTTITKEKQLLFEPFMSGGMSIGLDQNKKATPGVALQFGAFIKGNCGFSVGYQYLFGDIQNHIVSGQFLYKF
jgi:hypothetical protein